MQKNDRRNLSYENNLTTHEPATNKGTTVRRNHLATAPSLVTSTTILATSLTLTLDHFCQTVNHFHLSSKTKVND